jgi:hypothetical protein
MTRTPLIGPSNSLLNSNRATKTTGGIREGDQRGETPNFSKISI